VKISTPAIQAKHALQRTQTEDYVEWATSMLEAGEDSENLRILAGLSRFASPFEAEEHFRKARKELGISEPTKVQAIRDYAIHLAQQIIDETIPFQQGVEILSQLCYSNDYPKYLMGWYNLDDGLTDIRCGQYPHTYPDLYGKSPKEIVIRAAHTFIKSNTEPGAAPHAGSGGPCQHQ
jgi:hypothetical protein